MEEIHDIRMPPVYSEKWIMIKEGVSKRIWYNPFYCLDWKVFWWEIQCWALITEYVRSMLAVDAYWN